jgi:diguanylate cyclase
MWGILIELLSATAIAAAGVIGGWWLARRGQKPEGNGDQRKQAREALLRVHEVATQVVEGVGEHSSRVGKINRTLRSPEPLDSESVVQAVAELLNANQSLEQQLKSAEHRLLEQARQIECHVSEALTDGLTDLANRRAFDREMDTRLADFRHHKNAFCLALLDVDHFKRFNDTYGHQAGDEVLRGVASVLRRSVRAADFVARYGGEEFAMICPGTTLAEAKGLADRVRREIDKARFRFNETDLHVTASVGVARSLVDEETAGMIQRADAALYAAKAGGRNCVRWHDGQEVYPRADDGRLPEPEAASDRDDLKKSASAVQRGLSDEYFRLPNRTAFCTVLNHRLAEWHRVGVPLSALLIRIDGYSRLVSRHGEAAAHAVLGVAARSLRAADREMDMVARYDTSTFAIALPNTGVPEALGVAERMRKAVAGSSMPLDGENLELTVSAGGSEAMAGDDTVRLLERAEDALRAAGSRGGNCSLFHNGHCCEPISVPVESAE